MKQGYKTLFVWVVVFITLFIVYHIFSTQKSSPTTTTFSEFLNYLEEGKVSTITIKGRKYIYQLKGGTHFYTTIGIEPDVKLTEMLREKKVEIINLEEEEDSNLWTTIIFSTLPVVILVIFLIIFMRQLQTGSSKALSFGKSRAKLLLDQKKVTFNDVAGIDEAKEEVIEIVEFLKNPKKFLKLGGRIPKGVLLMGPPGTGKTLLARAIAGEAGVPFFSISGSDFVEMFVGVGAARVRDLFEQGKKHAPCIIFIDEIDAVGRYRGAGLGGGHDEREQTLNQLLVEMDGFEQNEGLIIIAATNRPDVLDPALLRPGRFDRRIVVPRPDLKGRLEILKIHTRKVPLGDDVDLELIAKGTPGFVGSDLESLVNEAALLAARKNKEKVEMEDFEQAKDKLLMGTERKNIIISEKEKNTTAYHEAGHTLVAISLPGTDPVHKVSIIPRGMALGVTQQLPQEDRFNLTKEFAENQICVLMGGRAAEEIAFNGEISTGSAQDIKQATQIAKKMVCEWGMSEKIGPLSFGAREETVFLGKEIVQRDDISEKTAIEIDSEVKRIVTEQYRRAKEIITKNRDKLERLAKALLKYEVLDRKEIEKVLAGEELNKEIKVREPIKQQTGENEKEVETKKEDGLLSPDPFKFPTGS